MRDLQSNLVLGPSDDLQPLPCDKEKMSVSCQNNGLRRNQRCKERRHKFRYFKKCIGFPDSLIQIKKTVSVNKM